LMDYVTKAVDFGTEQVPLIAQELLTFGLYTNILGVVIYGVLFLLSLGLVYLSYRHFKDHRNEALYGLTLGIALVVVPLLGVGVGFCISDIIKIQTAPKVYVLQHMSKGFR